MVDSFEREKEQLKLIISEGSAALSTETDSL